MTAHSNARAWLKARLPKGATIEVHVSWEPNDPHYVYVYLPATDAIARDDITSQVADVAGLDFDGYTRAIEVNSTQVGAPAPYVVGTLAKALHGTPRALTVREIRA